MHNRKIKFIILPLLCAAFFTALFMIGKEVMDGRQAQADFESLAEYIAPKPAEETPDEPQSTETLAEETITAEKKRNIAGLQEQNPDCVGWLSIPGTAIDYPVMHTPDEPQRYLRKNFEGKYSTAGVPFLDARCSTGSKNLIIYGHNMRNGTMFSDLKKYLDEDYRAEHSVIEFETVDGCSFYTVSAVRTVDRSDAWYSAYVSELFADEQYLTLSTCYGSGKDGRLIVIATKN